MSLASEWVALVDDVQEQEPPRFTATVVKQARVSANGNVHTQLLFGTVTNQLEIPRQEAIDLAAWIVATFGGDPPVLTSLEPNTHVVGPGFLLRLHGTGFTADCVVFANNIERASTFVSATELNITTQTVSNPTTVTIEVGVGPTGPRSNSLPLTITAA